MNKIKQTNDKRTDPRQYKKAITNDANVLQRLRDSCRSEEDSVVLNECSKGHVNEHLNADSLHNGHVLSCMIEKKSGAGDGNVEISALCYILIFMCSLHPLCFCGIEMDHHHSRNGAPHRLQQAVLASHLRDRDGCFQRLPPRRHLRRRLCRRRVRPELWTRRAAGE